MSHAESKFTTDAGIKNIYDNINNFSLIGFVFIKKENSALGLKYFNYVTFFM